MSKIQYHGVTIVKTSNSKWLNYGVLWTPTHTTWYQSLEAAKAMVRVWKIPGKRRRR